MKLYENIDDPRVEECPFCGSLHTRVYLDEKGYHCGCLTENCTGYMEETRAYKTIDEAVHAWNIRKGVSKNV